MPRKSKRKVLSDDDSFINNNDDDVQWSDADYKEDSEDEAEVSGDEEEDSEDEDKTVINNPPTGPSGRTRRSIRTGKVQQSYRVDDSSSSDEDECRIVTPENNKSCRAHRSRLKRQTGKRLLRSSASGRPPKRRRPRRLFHVRTTRSTSTLGRQPKRRRPRQLFHGRTTRSASALGRQTKRRHPSRLLHGRTTRSASLLLDDGNNSSDCHGTDNDSVGEEEDDREIRAIYCCPICYIESYRRLVTATNPNGGGAEDSDDESVEDQNGDEADDFDDLETSKFKYGPIEILESVDMSMGLASNFCFRKVVEVKSHLRLDHSGINLEEISKNDLYMRFNISHGDGLLQRYLKLTRDMKGLGRMSFYWNDGHNGEQRKNLTTSMYKKRNRQRTIKTVNQRSEDQVANVFWNSFTNRSHRIWRVLKQAYDSSEEDLQGAEIVDDDVDEEGEVINHDLIDREERDEGEEAEEDNAYVKHLHQQLNIDGEEDEELIEVMSSSDGAPDESDDDIIVEDLCHSGSSDEEEGAKTVTQPAEKRRASEYASSGQEGRATRVTSSGKTLKAQRFKGWLKKRRKASIFAEESESDAEEDKDSESRHRMLCDVAKAEVHRIGEGDMEHWVTAIERRLDYIGLTTREDVIANLTKLNGMLNKAFGWRGMLSDSTLDNIAKIGASSSENKGDSEDDLILPGNRKTLRVCRNRRIVESDDEDG